MILPERAEPEVPAFAGPDPALPALYEFVASPPRRPYPRPPLTPPPAPPVAPENLSKIENPPRKPSQSARSDDLGEVLEGAAVPRPEQAPTLEEHAAAPGRMPVLRDLAVVPDIEGPHVRLALGWVAVSLAATGFGRYPLGALMAVVGLLAGGQVARSWRRRPQRPAAPLVVLGAAALPAAASAGIVPMALAALVVVAAAVAAPALVGALGPPHRRGARAHANPALTVALALGVGLAAAAPVLVRHRGFAPAFVLLSLAGAYDASAYLVGSGASSAWEGPAAGVASIAAMTLAVAALFVPPFSGSSPWILGLVAAVLTPMGPLVGSLLLGERVTAAPALRRLDSLLVMGPLWAALALVLLK